MSRSIPCLPLYTTLSHMGNSGFLNLIGSGAVRIEEQILVTHDHCEMIKTGKIPIYRKGVKKFPS